MENNAFDYNSLEQTIMDSCKLPWNPDWLLPEEPNPQASPAAFPVDLAETPRISVRPFKSPSAGAIYIGRDWKSGHGGGNAQPCYTGFALSDLVVSGALPPEGKSALHRFPQAPTA